MTDWLRARAGRYWPQVVKAADSAGTAFLLTFVGFLVAHGVTAEHLGVTATWQAAGLAGLVAAFNAAKSAVMVATTGQTALGAIISTQLRAQRDTRPVRHPVPLKKPRRRTTPTAPPAPHRPPAASAAKRKAVAPRHGAHEAPDRQDSQ